MTYAERELKPLGFNLVEKEEVRPGFVRRLVLSFGYLNLIFDCCCPAYPDIKALGCPIHHSGPGGSSPIEQAKRIPTALFGQKPGLPSGVNPDSVVLVDGVYYDLCVLCRVNTSVRTDRHVDERANYVDTYGQLCKECYEKTA